MAPYHCLLCLSLLLLCCFLAVEASSGDVSWEFQTCLVKCGAEQCNGQFEASKSLALRLTQWKCTDECKYTCMHNITDQAISNGRAIQQYYGKWPFWRFWGMQEPASVVFSLANLWSHWSGFKMVRRVVPSSHPMKNFYLLWSVLSINAWLWSAVFHTRGMFRPSR